jgi:hypothetical protein
MDAWRVAALMGSVRLASTTRLPFIFDDADHTVQQTSKTKRRVAVSDIDIIPHTSCQQTPPSILSSPTSGQYSIANGAFTINNGGIRVPFLRTPLYAPLPSTS